MLAPMPPARTPRRVAVVAVPGVGDDQPGDVGTAITDALALPGAAGIHPFAQPLATIQGFYPLAEAVSRARGFDPDRPPHLSKVTETR